MKTSLSTLHLRPHHLLCLQTFIGHGYSEEFVQEMTSVKRQLELDPGTPIQLVDGADTLCRRCPNCAGGHCTSDKPALFDRLLAAKIEKSENISLLRTYESNHGCIFSDSFMLHGIPEYLTLSHDLLEECCPGCEWKELCDRVIDGNEK
jgi:hypothetical protein